MHLDETNYCKQVKQKCRNPICNYVLCVPKFVSLCPGEASQWILAPFQRIGERPRMADHISSWKVAVFSFMSVAASEQLPKLLEMARATASGRCGRSLPCLLAGEARRQLVSYGFATKK